MPLLIGLFVLAGDGNAAEPQSFSVVIRGGQIIDGTGRPAFAADIAINDGHIVGIGDMSDAIAKIEIDASSLVVAPGFIDAHNHTVWDIAAKDQRLNEGFVRQGVTTVVGGADGYAGPEQIEQLIEAYHENGIGTNVAFYVGHGGVRRAVMREQQQRPPTPEELQEMKSLVRDGMQMGALGLSTGLMYEPGIYSETNEVIALAKVVAPFNGIYDSHVRNPVHELLRSDRELIDICRAATIGGKIGHLKAVGMGNAGAIKDVIQLVEDARSSGLNIVSDQYPYDGAQTSTLKKIIVVPTELQQRADFDLMEALVDAEEMELIRQATEQGVNGGFAWVKAVGYSSMRILKCKDSPALVGKHLSELPRQAGDSSPFDAVVRLLTAAQDTILLTLGSVKEADVRELLVQPWNMIASDGSYVDSRSIGFLGHPRSTGTFPRVLGHYVREVGLLTLEEAVRKMTSLPADFLGLEKRGRIKVGHVADIVVFDATTIRDTSTWTNPNSLAVGVKHLLVNGISVVHQAKLTGDAPGVYIKRNH